MKFLPRLSGATLLKHRVRIVRATIVLVAVPILLSGCVSMVTGETPAQKATRDAPPSSHIATGDDAARHRPANVPPPNHAQNGIPEANLTCFDQGRWLSPESGSNLTAEATFSRFVDADYVLLGETHDQAEHHRWQLHTAAAIFGRHPNMALGFEMFPRAVQPVLDQWVAGKLSEKEFLKQARWGEVWNYPSAIYMPLFQFARQNRIPMMALNVEHDLVRRVRKEGWDAVPVDEKEGVTKPAEPLPAYRDFLFNIYREHVVRARQGGPASGDQAGTDEINTDDEGFVRFTQSQRTWDRAMAQQLIKASQLPGRPLVVGIIGTGHLINRFGVSYQLADLGANNTMIALPWDGQLGCDMLKPGAADVVFGLTREIPKVAKQKPLLGVMLRQDETDVVIIRVVEDSVAENAGLKADDVVVTAAGEAVKALPQLISIVQRQSPGTWLPLTVRRDGKTIDLMAKFPSAK